MLKKCKDLGRLTILCIIGNCKFDYAMLDLGASINVMPLSIYNSLGLELLSTTGVVIQLVNGSNTHPSRMIENVLVRVNELIFPANFYILEMEGESSSSKPLIILERPFLKTIRTKIDIHAGILTMEFGDQMVRLSVFDSMKQLVEQYSVLQIDAFTCPVEEPLSDLLAKFPRLVDFDQSYSLSCSDCNGDYIYPVCAEINACINVESFVLTNYDTSTGFNHGADLGNLHSKKWLVILQFLRIYVLRFLNWLILLILFVVILALMI